MLLSVKLRTGTAACEVCFIFAVTFAAVNVKPIIENQSMERIHHSSKQLETKLKVCSLFEIFII